MARVNVSGEKTVTYFNGEAVQSHTKTPEPKAHLQRTHLESSATVLAGPKLKIKRAKSHVQELETLAKAFRDSDPYDLIHEVDPKTSENVYRVRVKKDVPVDFSAPLGDAAHNLRCVLDYLVCDLVRAANNKPHGGSGFPIKREAKRFKPGNVPKIDGVSPKAERLLLRLKSRNAINQALWVLHMLDIIDKHNSIVTVAAATVPITTKVGVPGMFIGPDGNIRLLGPGPGGVPMMVDAGTPDQFRRVFPLQDNVEIHRSPAGFNEEVKAIIEIAFGQGQVAEGEAVIETLKQITNFVERILGVAERSCF